jgi:DNA primase
MVKYTMSDQVDEIKQKTDIVGIISEHVELTKAGKNFKGACPFHNEKSPSFIVSSELQMFKCFGCGEAGDVYTFLQKYDGMTFYESLKYLADKAGVRLQSKNRTPDITQRIIEINSLLSKFYHYMLTKHPSGKHALNYLINERQIKLDTIKTFQLGYSPDMPLALKKFIIEKNKISVGELEKAGVVYSYSGSVMDRFRGRVIFPLHDHRGNCIGFAGRTMPGSNTNMAKYINTPETPVYHKSKHLYGFQLTKDSIKKSKKAVIVEGELDLISSWQVGIKNTAAIKGSALTAEHTALLSRFTDEIVLALDADFAGDVAARRGINIAQNAGLEISVAQLAGYKDPDEAARADPVALKTAIKNTIGIWDFLINMVFSKHPKGDAVNKSRIGREIFPLLANIEDPIMQSHYIDLVAKRLKIDISVVTGEINKVKLNLSQKVTETLDLQKPEEKEKDRKILLEERLFALALGLGKDNFEEEIKDLFSLRIHKKIFQKYKEWLSKNPDNNLQEFAKSLSPELGVGFTNLALLDVEISSDNPELLSKEYKLTKNNLLILTTKQKLKNSAAKIEEFESNRERDKLEKEQAKFRTLTHKLHHLENELRN